MTKSFLTVNSLCNSIKKGLKSPVEQMGILIRSKTKSFVHEQLYKAYTPSDYIRTWELMKSLTKSKTENRDDGYYFKIFYDTSKIQPNYVAGHWNQHMDNTKERNDVSEFIPLWIEEGTPNNPFYKHRGINAMEKVVEIHSVEFIKRLASELRKAGYEVTIY